MALHWRRKSLGTIYGVSYDETALYQSASGRHVKSGMIVDRLNPTSKRRVS